jgi:uncharacterized membrane protein YecN with MAPEG domain
MLPVTSLLTGGLAALLVWLSLLVSLRRIKAKVSIGDGGDEVLIRRIRAQANLVEYAPMGLIALALVEYRGVSTVTVLGIGAALVLGRLVHAAGMLAGILPFRSIGMILTYISLLSSAGWLVFGPTL